MKLLRTILAVALLATCLLPATSEARVWTSTDGKKLEAIFESLEGDTIQLKLRNGQSVKLPISRLIPDDYKAAERFALIGDDAMTMASAKRIDSLLSHNLGVNGIESFNERLPDDLFVRRVYLDIIGRIPTREEFQDFADSASEDKRAALIDTLLASSGRASHLFNYFADMYRVKADARRELSYEPYAQWWRDSLDANVPYTEIVHQMITANGNLGHNPATGFLERDEGMEFDAFANFGQVMMGIDLSCAQCHDHPFEEWTMDDFYQMAAFFGQTQRAGQRYKAADGEFYSAIPGAPEGWSEDFEKFALENGLANAPKTVRRQFGWYKEALGLNIQENDEIDIPVPATVDHIGGSVMSPLTLYGDNAKMGGKTRREALADWMISPTNERFALNIANRMWERAFGKALVEPVIDFPIDWEKHTGQPEVLKFLGHEMVRVNYDLREFMRILYNTQAYQGFSTYDRRVDEGDHYLFRGPVLRRMRAEQTWDSLLTLAYGSEIDKVYGGDGSFMKELLNVDFENDSMEQVFAKWEAYESNRSDRSNWLNRMLLEPGSLQPTNPEIPVIDGIEMLRASRQTQATKGGLLSDFGQSDRMVTDDHIFDGTVPQVLALMNGKMTTRLTGSNSQLVEDLNEYDGADDKVRGVFFTMLSRYPTDEELKKCISIMEDYGDDGVSDLAWALLNTPEFLFIQ